MIILFNTYVGNDIGYGHLYRCLSLAKALEEMDKNQTIVFLTNKESFSILRNYNFEYIESDAFNDIYNVEKINPDITILDSYEFSDRYLKKIKRISKLILIDDNNDVYDSKIPDLVLNGNIHAEDLEYKSAALLGLKYLVMRSEYWDVQITNGSNNKIIITTGGSDFNNLMPKFIQSLRSLQYDREIIIGPGYNNKEIRKIEEIKTKKDYLIYKPSTLIDIFNDSAIILTASGTSIYEILRLNKIPIIYTLADNQIKIAKKLEEYGVINLGNYKEIDYNSLENIVNEQLKKIEKKRNELKDLFEMFDGQGSIRVAKYILEKVI